VEVGTTIGNFIATVAFNYGSIIPLYPAVPVPNPSNGPRVGSVTSYAFSGIIANTSGLASTSPQQTVVATSGNNTVNVTVSFGQGPQPRNSTGAITDVNNVNYTPYAAGSMNSSASFEGKYKIFYGPSLTDHVSGTGDARSLSSFFVSGTTFNMFPGITATSFYVYIPVSSGLSLTNVVASTFENLTVYYVLVTSSFQIPDAGGNLVTYKKYKMTNAIPYTNPALYHTITISIA
jgi:hypothetical protein